MQKREKNKVSNTVSIHAQIFTERFHGIVDSYNVARPLSGILRRFA